MDATAKARSVPWQPLRLQDVGAKNGVPLTEIFCGTDGSEQELIKLASPTSSYKLTMAMQPKMEAQASIETLYKMVKGEIKMKDASKVVDVFDLLLDGWKMDATALEKFLKEQYFSDVKLRK